MEKPEIPTLFISYSHDNEEHKSWVLNLATRIRNNHVNVLLDRWDLRLGSDLPSFMEHGLTRSHLVLCICSTNYVSKANKAHGGVGYEKLIMTAELLKDLNSNWVIPLIRNNESINKTPTFLSGRVYIDFSNDSEYETKYEELIREIHDERILPLPPIGPYPFKNANKLGHKVFNPLSEKYTSPAPSGTITFDYSNNNGRYTIGQGALLFETCWSKAGATSIHMYSDSTSLSSIANAINVNDISDIEDATIYDTSSRTRLVFLNHIAVCKNVNGYYAAIKVISIKIRDSASGVDELKFQYKIQSNGSANFSN